MATFHFNAAEVTPDAPRMGAIMAGWYKAMITKTELKPTDNGQYLSVQISVVDGPCKGAVIFNNFNVINSSEKAQEIGRKQLSALCHAIGVLQMSDTDQLKDKPFITRLKKTDAVHQIEGDTTSPIKYEEKNEPTAFVSANDTMGLTKVAETQAKIQGAVKPAGAPQQGYTPPPAAQQQYTPPQMQQQAPQQFAPPQQHQAPQQQYQAPPAQAPQQQQFQAPPAQQPQAQQQVAEGQPAWANAPQQPWGQQPAAQAPQQQQAPVQTQEQQQQYQQTMAAPPPWGAPQ